MHFLGEVEVVFGLCAVVLAVVLTSSKGWSTTSRYLDGTVNYTEPLFVDLKAPLLVGFFPGGLVIHGGLKAGGSRRCWRACLKRRCSSARPS